MGLDVDAAIVALSATYGLLPNLDVGVALPFVSVSIGGTALAVVDSRTLSRLGAALHFFGGTPLDPVLTAEEGYDDSVAGIGDVALRAKYHFPTSGDYDLGALLDVRLPTGSQEDYLGTCSGGVQLALLASASLDGFTPHANVGYSYRGSAAAGESGEFSRSGVRFAVSFDQQIVPCVTFALDLLGTLDVGDDPLPGSVFIRDSNANAEGQVGEAMREVRLTNVPADRGSSTLDASIGARVAFSERFQALANVLVPLNDNGLRSSIVPTAGVSLTF